ncbi:MULTISPECIES: envelope stress response protein PspG [Pantoea]|uniref:Phage shock protein G n=2 Tax=Pantoea stewartii TaxID=66269 RepID=H3RJ83_PANSE|nr:MULTISPECIES: envelope stress response protein PspG [Pantoea]KKW52182.1 phage-shock protein [Pantoea ananatis]ARF48447.1 phage shock protein G [Pantoea stewartii subsp. stewartii DC283]EHT98340.1 putative inner membrane protein [Pantoea stewartii subsp. stewartii DC283]KAB0554786.1 envelope stress response protein PspG [Pantoea stewartii subsp. stewartii]KGD84068.1 phage-shock protein [Pantoea stewartii subsp. indologenes]
MDIIFVFGFFLMLLLTGVSLIGVIAALVVATIVMFVGGMVMLIVKVLPWLLLAVAAVWLYRRFFTDEDTRQRVLYRRRIRRLERNGRG